MKSKRKALPKTVSRQLWEKARAKLLAKEKAMTRALDALAAERRRMPMVKIDKNYVFKGESGEARLLDLFEGRNQLILYHFMFGPNWEEGCNGCSMVMDNMPHLAHLHARNVSFAIVSRAPLTKLNRFKKRMGWKLPWYSSLHSDFSLDFGASSENGETFGLSVFLRDGKRVYQTYHTNGRGVEHLGSVFTLLDITPYGRQEDWEDSPKGWPKTDRYTWWRHHDRYESK